MEWENIHQEAFEQSKEAFLKEIVIEFPDFTKPFFLNTDASNMAFGGDLYQIQEKDRHA